MSSTLRPNDPQQNSRNNGRTTASTRICKVCGIDKPINKYHLSKNSWGKFYYDRRCKQCDINYANEYNRLHPETKRARERRYYRLNPEKRNAGIKMWRVQHPDEVRMTRVANKYGLNRQQLQEMINFQDTCPICHEVFTSDNPPVVDHDHENGMVRQLVHNSCNKVLGFSGENIIVLQGAIDYLIKWNN